MRNLILLTALLLSACTQNLKTADSHAKLLELGDLNYSIQIPNVPYVKKLDDGNVAATSQPDDPMTLKDWRIEIFEKDVPTSCSSSITGASEMAPIQGASKGTVWGKVDYWDRFNSDKGGHGVGGGIDGRVVCTNYGIPIYPAIYGLCSEKDGKTVVICINQMTDNEPLAKSIFETFRWTE